MNPIVSSKRKTVVKLEVTNVTPVLVGLEFTTHQTPLSVRIWHAER